MKPVFNVLIFSLFLFSCNSEPVANDALSVAEFAYQESPTAANMNNLTAAYTEYLEKNPGTPKATEYRLKLAEIQMKNNRFTEALANFKTILRNDIKSPQAPKAALNLAELYGTKLNNPLGQSAVYQGFIKAFPNHGKVGEVKSKVSNDTLDMAKMLQDLGGRIYSDQTNRIDYKVGNDFINIAEIHAMFLPDDPNTAEYLHDAGRTAGYMKSFPKAIDLYGMVVEKYPNHEQTANSTFMLGYTYDNDLKDYGEARKYYEMFLSKYPSHDLAASAKVLLENLGVPDDQIIEKLQKNG